MDTNIRMDVAAVKRAAKWFLGLLVLLALAFIGGAYMLPDEAVVQRQTIIAASVDKVWPLVSDLRRFDEFSRWAEADPQAGHRFEGPESGVGQAMIWTSDRLGKGSRTITEIVARRRVASALDFGRMGCAQASFELSPIGAGTGVTWGLKCVLKNPLERWKGLMLARRIGRDYGRGLAKLKAVAEKENGGK